MRLLGFDLLSGKTIGVERKTYCGIPSLISGITVNELVDVAYN
ncbi:MAG: hypothetical protein OEW78_01070 [Nitrosopumilus sp.]|nr:hypothetical protein [Nitrosopumilus sp.]MDH5430459.1 hypothetical protein [Nitrosopumilus sp.]MDH5697182.1 hypothetical protein [Nitrosopumilus sp.]